MKTKGIKTFFLKISTLIKKINKQYFLVKIPEQFILKYVMDIIDFLKMTTYKSEKYTY